MNVHFNSHAHVERDYEITSFRHLQGISTHTLTWSVTFFRIALQSSASISTHTLTWSVTCLHNKIGHGKRNFNSHAHVERDYEITSFRHLQGISTHTLTWSVTFFRIALQSSASISTHTLTWSVTCLHNKIGHGKRNFNSHAHVERDAVKSS